MPTMKDRTDNENTRTCPLCDAPLADKEKCRCNQPVYFREPADKTITDNLYKQINDSDPAE